MLTQAHAFDFRRMLTQPLKTSCGLALAFLLCGGANSVSAYDLDALGAPKFVNTIYIELSKIQRISRFRSMVGHNYSDASQFGTDGIKDSRNIVEQCRSMKHYFIAPDSTVNIYAPVAGTVTSFREGALGATIEIKSDVQPDFNFGLFHVNLTAPLAIGDHVAEGQHLGRHIGTDTWSDISVWVQTPRGKHLISYFEILTDSAFETFRARGVTSVDSMIRTKANRDADPNVCSFGNPPETDFVALSGPVAASQTITALNTVSDTLHIGDAPVTITGTASSGLPVTLVSATPKICTTADNAVTPRRPGVCKLQLTQPGNAATYEAAPITMRTTVLPQGVSDTARPSLSTVFPPAASGPQSYVRFYNSGAVAGTVTASLVNGSSGQVIATWQSPSIAAGASPQYPITTLEAAAAPGFTRPGLYSVRVEPATTIDGYMQHVMFDPVAESFSNVTTCDVGMMASSHRLMNVHSSRLDFGYPSTVILNNIGITSVGMGLMLRDAADGAIMGRFYSSTLPLVQNRPTLAAPNAQVILSEAITETSIQPISGQSGLISIAPPNAYHFNMIDEAGLAVSPNSAIYKSYYQHLVTNRRSGVVTDMSTVCALNGRSTATANALLRVGSIFSSLQASAQSYLRFYNSGTTAGALTVKLYGTTDDQPLGTWVSPVIPAGTMQEYPITTIERELTLHRTDSYVPPALVKQNFYGLSVQTDIDGYFQHILWRDPDGAFSNLSTCADAVTSGGKTLMGVLSSAIGTVSYASSIVVANTGTISAAAKLLFYDARDGALIGSYQTDPIAASGQLHLDVATTEAAARMSPDAGLKYYIVKVEEPFTGFLHLLVHNRNYGVISDMTAACAM